MSANENFLYILVGTGALHRLVWCEESCGSHSFVEPRSKFFSLYYPFIICTVISFSSVSRTECSFTLSVDQSHLWKMFNSCFFVLFLVFFIYIYFSLQACESLMLKQYMFCHCVLSREHVFCQIWVPRHYVFILASLYSKNSLLSKCRDRPVRMSWIFMWQEVFWRLSNYQAPTNPTVNVGILWVLVFGNCHQKLEKMWGTLTCTVYLAVSV